VRAVFGGPGKRMGELAEERGERRGRGG